MESSRNWPSSVFAALPPGAAVCVGLSGGLDSVVLLDLLAKRGTHPLAALHVHHGLSPNADAWAQFCARLCAARGVPLAIERVVVARDSGEGLEAAARAARYAAYAQRPEPIVALGHHLDDQAETVLLQLLRGTGLKGIAAMPQSRPLAGSGVTLYRPLLATPRAEIRAYAGDAGLEWIEDESNAASAHDRNYLRNRVAPLLDARFPNWRDAVTRFSRHAGSAHGLLDDLARHDGAAPGSDTLAIVPALSPARRANALRAFLGLHGLAMPSEARLAEMAKQFFGARPDAQVRIEHDAVALVRFRERVHIQRDVSPPGEWRIAWRGENEIDLGAGRGMVRFDPAHGAGIAAACVDGADWFFMPRSGGEKIRLDALRRTRTLKNLLQEHAVPAWQRDKLPLLFRGGELAWVPGIGVAAEFACGEGAEGFLPCWTVAGGAALC